LWYLLFYPGKLRRFVIPYFYAKTTQFSGINAFVYYTPTLFQTLGQGYNESLILSGMMNIAQLFGVIPTLLFMDRIGRRPLAIWGAIGMGIPHAIMAGLTAKYSSDWSSHPGAGWVCVAVVCE
jgi:MFS family permease